MINNIEDIVMEALCKNNLTIATAESCTGGMVSARLINYAGASGAFINGMCTYTNESKSRLLDINPDIIATHGAVSKETAEAMCVGVAKVSNADIGLSTTGVAGPGGGTIKKPVGLVYIGVSFKGVPYIKRLMLKGSRNEIRKEATYEVIKLLYDILIEKEITNG
ncbi:MAG: CinA family protein [Lachnospirales bacterium]